MQQISLSRIIKLFFIGLVSLFSIAFFILIATLFLPSPSDIETMIVSHTIPKYPNAQNWSVEYAPKNFDSSASSTYIKLVTNDTAEQIFDFYTKELTKKGWKLAGRGVQEITFTKRVFSLNFMVSTTKYKSIDKSYIKIYRY
jgi:hypothetical protein